MAKDDAESPAAATISAGYIGAQLGKALSALRSAVTPDQQARAQQRVKRWCSVLDGRSIGVLEHGSRTPLKGVPAWATPEVVTGGFATGNLLAGGALQAWELDLAREVLEPTEGDERLRLNRWCFEEAGFTWLLARLRNGDYRISVPEEGALLTVAWLLEQGRQQDVADLLEVIAPWFSQLRFYPEPLAAPAPAAGRSDLFVASSGQVADQLQRHPVPHDVAVQREVLNDWAPLYARTVLLFRQTWLEGWPCRVYPAGWLPAATVVVEEFHALQRSSASQRPASRHRDVELMEYLRTCVSSPEALNGRQVGRIRRIVLDHVAAQGEPDSPAYTARMAHARLSVAAPTHAMLAGIAADRLRRLPADTGVEDPVALAARVSSSEATSAIAAGTWLPMSVRRLINRCRRGSLQQLIAAGLVPSLESMAALLPQLNQQIAGSRFADPAQGRLFAVCQRAFGDRRSLLLLNLQSQVRLREIPWIRLLDAQGENASGVSDDVLKDVVCTALRCYPHTPLPNPMLRRLQELAGSNSRLPLVEELAADIFMGRFSDGFNSAARHAVGYTHDGLYGVYFGIDDEVVQALGSSSPSGQSTTNEALATLCRARAGMKPGRLNVAENGCVIEQAQILTTHNLAALFDTFQLDRHLADALPRMVDTCFRAVVTDLQRVPADWHSWMLAVKRSAYAWRQMIFFMSRMAPDECSRAVERLDASYQLQSTLFQARFAPAMQGLLQAVQGTRPDLQFLGWSPRHWLKPPG